MSAIQQSNPAMNQRDGAAILAPDARIALLALIALAAVGARISVAAVLEQPLESDALAYFTMARGLAEHGVLADQFGQHVFYSAGYPLLLAPFFAIFGSSVTTALAVNILLTVASLWLLYRLTHLLSGSHDAALLAAAAFALWFPGMWNAAMLAKENLSVALALALALCAVHIARGERPKTLALLAGVVWGGALVTGGSALPLCLGVVAALILRWRAHGHFAPAFAAGLGFLMGASVVVGPWLYATDRMVGRPVLTTNAAFNLYLGNNPAATGRFTSIADTPLGARWNEKRKALGETGNADRLQREAIGWIAGHPGAAAQLALRKLAYFWEPNIPDAADFAASKAVAMIRLIEVAQYLLIVIVGIAAFRSRRIPPDGKWIFAAMIVGFWLVHAAAYIIIRYRDPIMPLLIAMGSVPVAAWLARLHRKELQGEA